MSNKGKKKVGFNGLKLLCILSTIGFVYAMALDSSKYLTYSNFSDSQSITDSKAYEIIEEELENWEQKGVDVSSKGISNISKLYFMRGVFDVFALLGVTLMYFRIKIGFVIYLIFQLAYVFIPFLFLGERASVVISFGSMAINLIYVALFTTQRKYLLS